MSSPSIDSAITFSVSADWSVAFNKLKAGAHLCVISEPLSYHKTACNIEDAGFEIRDQLIWLFKDKHLSIVMARKPIEGTVIANLDKHGVGALNIDGCRIQGADVPEGRSRHGGGKLEGHSFQLPDSESSMPAGRWPANVMHDGSKEVLKHFPHTQSGKPGIKHGGNNGTAFGKESRPAGTQMSGFGDSGSAGRFYHEIKTKKELVSYLTKMITPASGKCWIIK